MGIHELIAKYDVPGPRYTSYPPVPFWEKAPTEEEWFNHIESSMKKGGREVDLYCHIPFCRSLCYYCGCNRIITKDQSRSATYLDALVKEWNRYRERLGSFQIDGIHFGGGTPTYMLATEIESLLESIFKGMSISGKFIGSFEADPRVTSDEHLRAFFKFGFKRISMGIQDLNQSVQEIIGRHQPFEMVASVTERARKIGIGEINFDLIYGLPGQSEATIEETFSKVAKLMPDTIAYYSYAHVPNFASNQKLLEKYEIPTGPKKRALYEKGRELLLSLGYIELGMDHFTLAGSEMAKAFHEKRLARNFMGYTVLQAPVLLGLGASSISSSGLSFIQNEKVIDDYYRVVGNNKLPLMRGHVHSDRDLTVGKIIHDLMCKREATIESTMIPLMSDFVADGLLSLDGNRVIVKEEGRAFLRNICMSFDFRLHDSKKDKPQFSRTI